MENRRRLDPQLRRSDELDTAKPLEADRRRARGDRDTRVDDELQRPERARAISATQFNAGVPSSRVRHSSGNGSMGWSSSRIASRSADATTRLPPSIRAGRRPLRIQRRTVAGDRPTRAAASVIVSMVSMVRRAAAVAAWVGLASDREPAAAHPCGAVRIEVGWLHGHRFAADSWARSRRMVEPPSRATRIRATIRA
jgi:hypothetical protein